MLLVENILVTVLHFLWLYFTLKRNINISDGSLSLSPGTFSLLRNSSAHTQRCQIPPQWSCHPIIWIEGKITEGKFLLHIASIKGNMPSVEYFIQNENDSNVQDHAEWTPLYEACNLGHLKVTSIMLCWTPLAIRKTHDFIMQKNGNMDRSISGRWCTSPIIFFLPERSGCIGHSLTRGYIHSIEPKGPAPSKSDTLKTQVSTLVLFFKWL